MMKKTLLHLLILIAFPAGFLGCQKYPENPNRPVLPYPIEINLSDYQYYNLWFMSGCEYINAPIESTSRGIIVYRQNETEFLAYDRMPPNYPDACTDNEGNTTRLVVDGGWVIDRCNNAYYNILNGLILIRKPDMVPNFPTDSVTVYPLIQYHTKYDAQKQKLTIEN